MSKHVDETRRFCGSTTKNPSTSANIAMSTHVDETRTLRRPPHGWGHKPNARLGDWCLLVFIAFCCAQTFRWIEATIDALLSI